MDVKFVLSFLFYVCVIHSGTLATTFVPRVPTVIPTNWLNEYLKTNPNPTHEVRVLEVSLNSNPPNSYSSEYLRGHILTADFFDLYKCVDNNVQVHRNVPDTQCFTDYVRSLGVWKITHVIVYHKAYIYESFRAWWIFRLFGHRNVSVLDGGFQKWTMDGFDTSTTFPLIQRSNISLKFDRTLIRTFEDMVANVQTRAEQVVDARSPKSPWIVGKAYDSGIIPDAKIVAYSELFNDDGTMKSSANLKRIFEDAGVNTSLPMVSYCNSGMKATVLAGAAHRLGKDIPVYNGSWMEWRLRAASKLKRRLADLPVSSNITV